MQQVIEEKAYKLWAVIYQSPDDCDVWVAQCLDHDIVAWGCSPIEARDELRACVEEAFIDDLNAGLDPTDRPKADKDAWAILAYIQDVGRAVEFAGGDVAKKEKATKFAVVLDLHFSRVQEEQESKYVPFQGAAA